MISGHLLTPREGRWLAASSDQPGMQDLPPWTRIGKLSSGCHPEVLETGQHSGSRYSPGISPTTQVCAEVDIMEFGYQIPGSTNSNYEIHTHLWGLGNNGTSAGDGSISNLAVTPGGWHTFGCLIEQASLPNPQVIFYLDGAEVERFNATAPFHVPEGVLLDMASGPGFPATGDPEELDCQYIRCWAPR